MGDARKPVFFFTPAYGPNMSCSSQRTHIDVEIDNDRLTKRILAGQRNIDKHRTELINLTKDDNNCFNPNRPVVDLTMDDKQHVNSNIPVIDLTSDNDQFANSRIPIIDLTDDDIYITDQIECIDLTNGNTSSSYANRHFDLTRNDDRDARTRSTELIDLTDDGNKHFNHNSPVFDLTSDKDQFANSRMPIIDLTDDDIYITDQIECIDLTNGNASSSSYTNRRFDLTRNYDRDDTIRSIELIDLTDHGNKHFSPNSPVIDLTCDKDEFVNYGIPVIDSTHADVQDITHHLQCLDLTDRKEQHNINDCISTTGLIYYNGQNIDQDIPAFEVTSREDYENYKGTIPALTINNAENIVYNVEGLNLTDLSTSAINRKDTVVQKPVEKMYDAQVGSSNQLMSSRKNIIENNRRIFNENPSYNAIEDNISESNQTSNINLMKISTASNMRQYQSRNDIIFTNYPPAKNLDEKDLSLGENKIISQNKVLDFMVPARHSIPFRHSLRRSTINTSKNVPIECTESSERGSRTMTVSSTFRRKKSKLSSATSKQERLNLSGLSTSRKNASSFAAVKEIFLKFRILFIFLFMFFILILYFTGF